MPSVKVIYLPPGDGGTKVGLDDFLAAGNGIHALTALATSELRAPAAPDAEPPAPPYQETPHGLVWIKSTKEGPVEVPLTNFTARILTDIAEDDGTEVHHIFEIEARLADRVRRFQVPACSLGARH